jgi:hypothetical protein
VAVVVAAAAAVALAGACARPAADRAGWPPPIRSVEPARPFSARGVELRVDSVQLGAFATELHVTVRNRSRGWLETRPLAGARLVAAGQTTSARGVRGLSAGGPGVVAPGAEAAGVVRFPPLPPGSLGLRVHLPLVLEGERLEAEFVIRLERGRLPP